MCCDAGRAGVAALEDRGAAADDVTDPLLAAGARDDVQPAAAVVSADAPLAAADVPADAPLAAADDGNSMPLAPAYEPDGMAQLESVDASADAAADSSLAPGVESVDALTDIGQDASLADAASGVVVCTTQHQQTVFMTKDLHAHTCLHFLHDACQEWICIWLVSLAFCMCQLALGSAGLGASLAELEAVIAGKVLLTATK
jgi:hypothetical protein